jgi:hypothetical protein
MSAPTLSNRSENAPRRAAMTCALAAALLLLPGCAPDVQGDQDQNGSAGHAAGPPAGNTIGNAAGHGPHDVGPKSLEALGTLSDTTSGGTHVSVSFAPDPPAIGPVELAIELRPAPAEPELVSVDLVSPEMPAHGVSRHEATGTDSPGLFLVRLSIPMEGLWEFYVNLDVGLDAVAFSIQVPPGAAPDTEGHPAHHGTHGLDDGHQHHFP